MFNKLRGKVIPRAVIEVWLWLSTLIALLDCPNFIAQACGGFINIVGMATELPPGNLFPGLAVSLERAAPRLPADGLAAAIVIGLTVLAHWGIRRVVPRRVSVGAFVAGMVVWVVLGLAVLFLTFWWAFGQPPIFRLFACTVGLACPEAG